METKRVLNLWCKDGLCASCPGDSKGSRSDPVTFECICICHVSETTAVIEDEAFTKQLPGRG
jgi:hypothetical protein